MGNGPTGAMAKRMSRKGPDLLAPLENGEDMISMPPEDEVNRLFEDCLDQMALKPEVRATMRLFPIDKRWMIVQQNEMHAKEEDPPEQWIARLDKEMHIEQTYLQLRPVINSSSKEWIASFVAEGGLRTLLSAAKTLHFEFNDKGTILLPCLMCLNAFMNNEVGIDYIVEDEETIEDMTLVFDSPNMLIKTMVLKLLSVIALIGYAHNILESFTKYKQVALYRQSRLFPIVETLRTKDDIDMRKTVMVFINATINFMDSLEERVAVRREYVDLGLLDVIAELRDWSQGKTGEDFRALINQIDIFENLFVDDKRETTLNELDYSDPDACYEYLRLIATEDGNIQHFLSILHQLLLVPQDSIGEEVWKTSSDIMQMIVTARDFEEEDMYDPDFYPYITYEELRNHVIEIGDVGSRYLSKIDELEDRLEGNRREIHQMKMKEVHLEEQHEISLKRISELETDLNNANQEIQQKIQELAEAKEKVVYVEVPVQGEQKVDQPKAVAPAPAPVVVAPPPPPPPPPPPVAVAPPPPPPPPPPPVNGIPVPPPPPAANGVPPPPPVGVRRPVRRGDPPPDGMNVKDTIDPGIKMKNFHWAKIKNAKIVGTIWHELTDEKVDIDPDSLKDQFSAPKKEKKKATKQAKKKKEVVKLIDDKRSYNIDLSLARFKVSPNAIHDAIMAMDEEMLNAEKLMQIIKCAPDPAEVETVVSYDGDLKLLGNTEKFFLALSDIPNLQTRLDMWLFKQSFEEQFEDVRSKLDSVRSALQGIRHSEAFRQFLEIILATGNFLNGGTKKGQAFGFKLNTLKQLVSTKAKDKKTTLLMYLIMYCEERYPDVRLFLDDFKDIPEAQRVESQPFLAEVSKINGKMTKLERTLEKDNSNPAYDFFKKVMVPFYENASEQVASLVAEAKETEEEADSIAVLFGEQSGKLAWEELLSIFNEFVELWYDSEKKIREMREKAQKEAKKKEAEMKRAARRKPVVASPKGDGGGVADALYDELVAADPKEVMKQIKARRAGRKKKGKKQVEKKE